MPEATDMRCFVVLIEGEFERLVRVGFPDEVRGFYTTRLVVAANASAAIPKAMHSAKRELEKWPDIRDGLTRINMQVESVAATSWRQWLRGGGRGFSFYGEE